LIALAYRPATSDVLNALARALLARRASAIDLGPLSRAEAVELVRDARGDTVTEAAPITIFGGVPFNVERVDPLHPLERLLKDG
jgi:hypothetical protein